MGESVNKYDFFICYRGETGGVLAANIYNEILLHSNNKIQPFFAPKCVEKGNNFYQTCIRVASQVPLMLLILSNGFFDACNEPDDVVYREIKTAMDSEETEFLPIIMQDFDFRQQELGNLFDEKEITRIKHVSALEFRNVYSFSAYEMLLPILREKIGIFDINEIGDKSPILTAVKRKHISDKTKKDYFSVANESEIKRLNSQQQLLLNYDMDVYEKYLSGKSHLKVLDIGCSDGSALMARLGNRNEVDTIIGIEYDEASVLKANENYGGDKAHFYHLDLEADDFGEKIAKIMKDNQIEKFDWINILAVISHLKSPFKVLRSLKKVCKQGGVFFVRNIDDGLNMAYPDPDNKLKKAFDLLSKCETVGYRYSGRELYSIFVNLDFSDIRLEKFGLSNVGMNHDDKTGFFDVIFKFISNGIDNAVKNHPTDYRLSAEKAWLKDNYDELEQRFVSKETFVNFGFLTYVAII